MNRDSLADKSTVCSILVEATSGLVYRSETDAPFELVQPLDRRIKLDPGAVRELAGRGPAERIEELSTTEFFAELTENQDWHGSNEKLAVDRYRTVQRIFETRLADAKVFRVGEIRLVILIVGQTADGIWIGLRTTAVET